jgi:hypothetical protein
MDNTDVVDQDLNFWFSIGQISIGFGLGVNRAFSRIGSFGFYKNGRGWIFLG